MSQCDDAVDVLALQDLHHLAGGLHGVRYGDVVEVSGHDEIEGVRCAEPEDPQPVAVPLDYLIRFEHQLPRVRVAQVGAYRIEFKLSCVVQIRLEPVVELMVPWDHEVISHRIQYVHGRAAVGEHRVSGTLERVPRVQYEDGGSAGLEVTPERCHPCEPEVLVIVGMGVVGVYDVDFARRGVVAIVVPNVGVGEQQDDHDRNRGDGDDLDVASLHDMRMHDGI